MKFYLSFTTGYGMNRDHKFEPIEADNEAQAIIAMNTKFGGIEHVRVYTEEQYLEYQEKERIRLEKKAAEEKAQKEEEEKEKAKAEKEKADKELEDKRIDELFIKKFKNIYNGNPIDAIAFTFVDSALDRNTEEPIVFPLEDLCENIHAICDKHWRTLRYCAYLCEAKELSKLLFSIQPFEFDLKKLAFEHQGSKEVGFFTKSKKSSMTYFSVQFNAGTYFAPLKKAVEKEFLNRGYDCEFLLSPSGFYYGQRYEKGKSLVIPFDVDNHASFGFKHKMFENISKDKIDIQMAWVLVRYKKR